MIPLVNCVIWKMNPARSHLFTGCWFSKEIWCKLLCLSDVHRIEGMMFDWSRELVWIIGKAKSVFSVILRLTWRCFVYHVWKERNNRLFKQQVATPQQVFDKISIDVRIRLAKVHIHVSARCSQFLLSNWGL